MPVAIFIQEAWNLLKWCDEDKDALLKTGLDRNNITDLPLRLEVLSGLETSWIKKYNEPKEFAKEIKSELAKAYNLYSELLRHFRFAFRFEPKLKSAINRYPNHPVIVNLFQYLSDLAALGELHISHLQAIHMDLSLFEKARETSFSLPVLYARYKNQTNVPGEIKLLRNKAYYHAMEAVGNIRKAGKYVFWDNKERQKGYISDFIQRKNQKQVLLKKKIQKTEPQI